VTAPEEGLVEWYLREQRELRTPVARAAEAHDRAEAGVNDAGTNRFRELIPLSAPGPGEQYAFEVDLDACTGCKSCVAACHSLNGLDEGEWWREVEGVRGANAAGPFQQFVTAACHHCADPGCLNGCPVLAYEKDPATGIVRHLDDQCIGCQYCVWMCPYEAPKYNKRLGIVRKCDLCHQRLAHGEAPACAQACPTQAIKIVVVGRDRREPDSPFFPTLPDPKLTQPLTRYVTERRIPYRLRRMGAGREQPAPGHWPLAAMLVLTQVSVGVLGAAVFVGGRGTRLAAILAMVGAAASVAHLGQPLRAWRVFLNARKSWLSREAIALGLYAAATAVAGLVEAGAGVAGPGCRMLAFGAGVLAVYSSVMVYAATGRPQWTRPKTAVRFFGLSLIAGLAWGNAPAAGAGLIGIGLVAIGGFVERRLFFTTATPPGPAEDE
jgi:Fe-S-cluster-containing dehydrogenase component